MPHRPWLAFIEVCRHQAGRRTSNRAPAPGAWGTSVTSPPIALARRRASGRPSPAPRWPLPSAVRARARRALARVGLHAGAVVGDGDHDRAVTGGGAQDSRAHARSGWRCRAGARRSARRPRRRRRPSSAARGTTSSSSLRSASAAVQPAAIRSSTRPTSLRPGLELRLGARGGHQGLEDLAHLPGAARDRARRPRGVPRANGRGVAAARARPRSASAACAAHARARPTGAARGAGSPPRDPAARRTSGRGRRARRDAGWCRSAGPGRARSSPPPTRVISRTGSSARPTVSQVSDADRHQQHGRQRERSEQREIGRAVVGGQRLRGDDRADLAPVRRAHRLRVEPHVGVPQVVEDARATGERIGGALQVGRAGGRSTGARPRRSTRGGRAPHRRRTRAPAGGRRRRSRWSRPRRRGSAARLLASALRLRSRTTLNAIVSTARRRAPPGRRVR